MTIFSGEGKGGGAYFEFHIQQGRLIEGGRLFEEIRYVILLALVGQYRGKLYHQSGMQTTRSSVLYIQDLGAKFFSIRIDLPVHK